MTANTFFTLPFINTAPKTVPTIPIKIFTICKNPNGSKDNNVIKDIKNIMTEKVKLNVSNLNFIQIPLIAARYFFFFPN